MLLSLMPASQLASIRVLDYGCGPGGMLSELHTLPESLAELQRPSGAGKEPLFLRRWLRNWARRTSNGDVGDAATTHPLKRN